ncbi:thiamine phosphate synthase [Actibacterium ureilyticum]|uniref:thiamine phosphate synthase n=1 Tax=Actibacterium ureilyticum TaxID=1590614 RepID=UPI000BAB1BB2|nr:thiamine phosphate synthase [Actibacterium ureilyticum]
MERFYPIVGDVDLLARIVPQGVRLVQLRLKDCDDAQIRDQVDRARAICAQHDAQLIVNDYWQVALDLGCDFVHLGQEDLDTADIPALRRAGVRFGLSTHDTAELDRALGFDPAYVALGPVYPTLLKKMKWGPQGLDRVSDWKRRAGAVPLVAIGGLTPARAPGVLRAGADSVAVVTDLIQADDPAARTREWLKVCA